MLIEGTELTNIIMMGGINLIYATVATIIGIVLMLLAYFIFDKITPFDTAKELKSGNVAVAIFNAAIVFGTGMLSALIVGMSVN